MQAQESTRARLDLRHAAGALARTALSSLEAPAELTQAAIGTWRGRMVNEHGSSRVFEALARQMQQAGFTDAEVTQVRGFADEERQHGIMCGAVVEALGGAAEAEALANETFPLHEDATCELEAVLRNAASIGCLSETVAVALIGAERLEMPEGPLEELLTHIWSDEVGHARFAWRLLGQYLPKLSEEGRRSLSAYLATAFAHLEEHELFYDTVKKVIIPSLEALGLAATTAWEGRHQA
jgi:hypothetical protein